ncbi:MULTISPECIES: glutamyl-tRNA reductase [Bacillus]|uniref:Glutamyl-tRNA reductase n=2 Tax=Bacillus TaxID=1386 RepID=A0A0M5JE63_9BACI|nr:MULTISPECIES: glutamyl-tRNA reductase [Bacillus]ALC81869.1 glutamyl-tRNA reductase [Bacillus gobiensis]MBP1083180.1 glutamyl-tRNA reductase [Bacillus capparidis]MED1097621.1 glutamyl-tRNA reductase [Bacillus capparidis]
MHILVAGINHKTAPVEIREKLSFLPAELSEAMLHLKDEKSILENIVVSTCNRTEIYAVVDQLHTGRYYIKKFLADWFQLDKEEIVPYFRFYENESAVEHLFRVSCGLDSMIIGETQILGQVRTSFKMAQEVKSIGTVFNFLFKQAVTLAKKSHAETEIGANAVSIGYAAVELARKIFGDLSAKHVVILGAGKMGELAVKNLHGQGIRKVTVINRTFSKAEELASRFSGEARRLESIEQTLIEADILISSTGSSDYVLKKDVMQQVNQKRKGSPLFMVDIAVPRDLDPAIAELDSVFLYDIDDLEGIVAANVKERQAAAEQVEIFIEEAIVEFNHWLNTLGVVPVISALRDKALAIQADTMRSIERKLPHLTERERKLLSKHTKSIINQMLRDPILKAKELAADPDSEKQLQLFKEIFNIEEASLVKTEEQKLAKAKQNPGYASAIVSE